MQQPLIVMMVFKGNSCFRFVRKGPPTQFRHHHSALYGCPHVHPTFDHWQWLWKWQENKWYSLQTLVLRRDCVRRFSIAHAFLIWHFVVIEVITAGTCINLLLHAQSQWKVLNSPIIPCYVRYRGHTNYQIETARQNICISAVSCKKNQRQTICSRFTSCMNQTSSTSITTWACGNHELAFRNSEDQPLSVATVASF